jgi:hypothetical protein
VEQEYLKIAPNPVGMQYINWLLMLSRLNYKMHVTAGILMTDIVINKNAVDM